MKVFIIEEQNYEGVEIYGIYSSMEKAVESFPFHEREFRPEDVEEYEVDPPNMERYEKFFSAWAGTDGSMKPCENRRMLPSDPRTSEVSYVWHMPENVGMAHAFGRSEEEAAQKATEGLSGIQPVWQVGRFFNSPRFSEIVHGHPKNVYPWPLPYAVHADINTARKALIDYEMHGTKSEFLFPKETP